MGRNRSLNFWIFNSCLLAFSGYLLYFYLPTGGLPTWAPLIFFAMAYVLFALLIVNLPTEEIISFEFVFLTIYILTYGFAGLWVGAVGTLVFAMLTKQGLGEGIYSFGSSVLTAWVATAIFQWAGGTIGKLVLFEQLLPLAAYIIAFICCALGFRVISNLLQAQCPTGLLIKLSAERFNILLITILAIVSTVVFQATQLPGLVVVILLLASLWKMLKVFHHAEQKYVKTVETFLAATENKTPQTRGHSERVAKYCRLILEELHVSREDRHIIENAALLHDIGKIGMPEKLLKVRGYLTGEEVHQLQGHAEMGSNLVKQIKGLEKVAELILCHHEKVNGTGYPRAITGDSIPFGARVIAIADQFDNLTFRDGLRFELACSELKNLAGSHLDEELVEVFLSCLLNHNQIISIDEKQFNEKLGPKAKDIVEQLRYYLDKSWVLGSIKMSYAALYEEGHLVNLGQELMPDSLNSYLTDYLARDCNIDRKEFIIDPLTAKIYDAYFVPVPPKGCLINIFDMTEVLKIEKERDERELKIYRDVISAVTQGKLLLAIDEELTDYLTEQHFINEMKLVEPKDVAEARNMVRGILTETPLPSKRKSQLILCVSEAATNVIKHVGEGKISIYSLEESIRIVIQDNGPGIDISQLPQLTLRKGYSTKLSLGYGFTIMLDYLDRLVMATRGGTTMVLEMAYSSVQKDDEKNAVGEQKVVRNNV